MKRIASLEDMRTESLEISTNITNEKENRKKLEEEHKKEEVKCRGRVSKQKEERER